MATPPTVLANTGPASFTSEPAPAKFPMAPLIVAVVIGALIAALGIGGGVYYLASTGRLQRSISPIAIVQPVTTAPTRIMVLDPLLLNLADANGNAYLRVSIALKVADPPGGKSEKKRPADDAAGINSVAAVRDTALMVLGRHTSGDMLKPDGKEQLKAELEAAFTKHNPELKVEDIFFVDFLVQR